MKPWPERNVKGDRGPTKGLVFLCLAVLRLAVTIKKTNQTNKQQQQSIILKCCSQEVCICLPSQLHLGGGG